MLDPDPEWWNLRQGPHLPPPDVYHLLNGDGGQDSLDPEMVRLAMHSYAGPRNDNGVFEGVGKGHYSLGYSYDGSYDGCRPHGSGKFTWDDGCSYTGTTSRHAVHGMGKYTFANGDTYQGEVVNGIRHGKGTYTKASTGEIYTGDWKDGEKHGKGRLAYSPSCCYEGDWVNGQRTGQGVMVYPSGSHYSGAWRGNARHGWGTMVWKDGRNTAKYVGFWHAGEMQGEGTHWYYTELPQQREGAQPAAGNAQDPAASGFHAGADPSGIASQSGGVYGPSCAGSMASLASDRLDSTQGSALGGGFAAPGTAGGGSRHATGSAASDLRANLHGTPAAVGTPAAGPGLTSGSSADHLKNTASVGSMLPSQQQQQQPAPRGSVQSDVGAGGSSTAAAEASAAGGAGCAASPSDQIDVNYYRGEFVAGQRHGKGCFLYKDGGRYEGLWEMNKKHGLGVYCLDNGVCYEGPFEQDKPTGSIAAPDKPALTRYVPLELGDLLMAEPNPGSAKSRIEALVSRYYWDLRQIYRHYSTSHLESEVRKKNLTALSLTQFWRFIKETKMSEHGISLAETDRIFLRFQKSYISVGTEAQGRSTPPLQQHHSHGTAPKAPRGGGYSEAPPSRTKKRSSSLLGSVTPKDDAKATQPPSSGRRRSGVATTLSRKDAASSSDSPVVAPLPPLKTVRNVHSGSGCMYFREFVEALVRIAHAKYKCYPSLSLADKLHMCLTADVHPKEQGSDTPCFYRDLSEINTVSLKHSSFLTKLYATYAQRQFNGIPVYRQRPKNDVVVTVRQFLAIMKDAGVVDRDTLPLRKVLDLFEAPSTMSAVIEATFLSPALLHGSPPELSALSTFPYTANGTCTTLSAISCKTADSSKQALAPFPPKQKRKKRNSMLNDAESCSQATFTKLSRADANSDSNPGQLQELSTRGGMGCDLESRSDGHDTNGRMEERRQDRMRQLDRITRGGNDCNVHISMTVDKEMVYEEFIDALVKAAVIKSPAKSKAQAFEHLVTTRLSQLEVF